MNPFERGTGLGSPALNAVFVVVAVLALVTAVVAGVLAYLGVWRSWYYDRPPWWYDWFQTVSRLPYAPLTIGWFSGAWLFLALTVFTDAVLDPIPTPLAVALLATAIILTLVSLFYIYPPLRFLPRWMREEEREHRAMTWQPLRRRKRQNVATSVGADSAQEGESLE